MENGKDYVILDTQGKGHYVGTVLAVRTRSPLWFGEGDEKIYIDGEKKPSIWGTGTEDFFCCAMGLESCSTPYFGVPQFNQFEIVGSMTSAYRWHLDDPIIFKKGIKVTIEHKSWISADENPENKKMSWNEREDDYSSVAFWYQTGESTFTARAPDARERKLPNIERVVAYGKDYTDAKHHGNGVAHVQRARRTLRGAAALLPSREARRGLGGNPYRGQTQGAAPLARQRGLRARLRALSSLARRRETGRCVGFLFRQSDRQGVSPARFLARSGHLHVTTRMRGQECQVGRQ